MSKSQASVTLTTQEVKIPPPGETTHKAGGILSVFPTGFRPYVEVTRLHKPAGLLGFYFPYLIAIFFTASIAGPWAAPPPSGLAWLTGICLVDGLLLRSFGCAWNDTIDRDVDRQVARCKGRPVARGALSATGAVLVTMVLALARHALVGILLPAEASCHALFVTALAFAYPFAKRFTNFPQLILGAAVGWAIFMVDAVVDRSRAGPLGDERHFRAVAALFLALTLWNVTYDTVYAFQDVQDDKRAGVKSMAVRFEHNAKVLLGLFIVAKSALLFYAGFQAQSQAFYHLGALAASVGALTMLFTLNLGSPKSCQQFFVKGQYVVSGAVLAGLVGEYLFITLGTASFRT